MQTEFTMSRRLSAHNYQMIMSLNFCLRARISEIRVRIFFVFNSYANSYVNFVHEIRTKFEIFGKLGKSSYEFARIRERYVTNGLYCKYAATVESF